MQSISSALNTFHADLLWFVRAKEIKLLTIHASSDLRSTILPLLPKYEFDRDNRSPWLLLEDAHTAQDGGWTSRAARLHEHWELRRQLFREREQIEMPAALYCEQEPSAASGTPMPLAAFESRLAAVLRAQRPPLDGDFVVVLAPGVIDNVEALSSELLALISTPALERARWVLLLDEAQPQPSIVDQLGGRALVAHCLVNAVQQRKDFAALATAGTLGRAGPRNVVPPPRVNAPLDAPPEVRDATLRAAGINPDYLDHAPTLARLLFEAAISMKDGRGQDALRAQMQARDLATQLSLHDVAALCSIALATYLSGLNRLQDAISELRWAIRRTIQHQLGMLEAQARMALGLLLAMDHQYAEAASEYAACARRAEAANTALIAIEGWRLAGQIALQLGDGEQTSHCFREALRIAQSSEIDVARISSAPEAARALARHYQENGCDAQAASLFQHADAIEQGEVSTASDLQPKEGAVSDAG